MSITAQDAPQPAVLRRKAAAAYTGLSEATLNRLANTGDGPQMTYVTPSCVGYRVSDLDAWLDSRPKARSTAERTVAMAGAA